MPESLLLRLVDDAELLGKRARLALVCPHPGDLDLLGFGIRKARDVDCPMVGLAGGEGWSPAMDVGADVWWVVEPLKSDRGDLGVHYGSGEIRLERANIEFAGTPGQAVDYLVRTPMHASAAVSGATLYAVERGMLASVGCLGVAISAAGPACAGDGGVAISCAYRGTSSVGDYGIAVSSDEGVAISGASGQSHVGPRGLAHTGRAGTAVAGAGGRAIGTQVVVGQGGEAEVVSAPGVAPLFSAGPGSRVHVRGTSYRAGEDFEAGVAYRVLFPERGRSMLERSPAFDAFAQRALREAGCVKARRALIEYFLEHRPLCSAAARARGLEWALGFGGEHGPPQLPESS